MESLPDMRVPLWPTHTAADYMVPRIDNVEIAWMTAVEQIKRGNSEIVFALPSILHLGLEGQKEIARRFG